MTQPPNEISYQLAATPSRRRPRKRTLLVSQAGNASALKMKLDAGQAYYFIQNAYVGGWNGNTGLSLHSRELVMYEGHAAKYAELRRRTKHDKTFNGSSIKR